ncbi:hypothetical protein BABINDRAFT_169098 [Babjeviella inositovora NRRL Y-12698]|uniref:Mediator of RNA polymerase II transcription subunit 20 n=1 Tax=Babjeviella inositovora NRRL Y-12698 TaxID=984486 RepID=A0A1E3QIG8_9ASCO|nr:uncharacterized protein BABINDRAFT_169098 [Babjeviella inositovora NRRL Y-12698]ODQ77489.1 hypothetical protein BABINDRAFT_169098 [Babjeviella inositovora NRRL Y-12698]
MPSAIVLVQNASPSTITGFHDQLSNELPKILNSNWQFEFKIFKNNPFSRVDPSVPTPTTFLYTLYLSYFPQKIISITNNSTSSIITSVAVSSSNDIKTEYDSDGDDDEVRKPDFDVPASHIMSNASTGLSNPWDSVLTSKLQSLWTLRQVIKGDNGNVYKLHVNQLALTIPDAVSGEPTTVTLSGALIIKTANCFLHGSFKGFLIEVEFTPSDGQIVESVMRKVVLRGLMEHYKFPLGKLCLERLNEYENVEDKYGDLCHQYAQALQF